MIKINNNNNKIIIMISNQNSELVSKSRVPKSTQLNIESKVIEYNLNIFFNELDIVTYLSLMKQFSKPSTVTIVYDSPTAKYNMLKP